MSHFIAPSILSGDFSNLQKDVQMLDSSEADWIHVDIMDGLFVPNISFGFPVMEAIRQNTAKPLDVHLMIVQPDRYIERFQEAGADNLIVHLEACTHLHRTIQEIKECGMRAGVALNPHTPIDALKDIICAVDQVLVMSVNPGFGGQKFIDHTFRKINRLRSLIDQEKSSALIGVDGGVDLNNAGKLLQEGANILVAGSAIFKSKDPAYTIKEMKNIGIFCKESPH